MVITWYLNVTLTNSSSLLSHFASVLFFTSATQFCECWRQEKSVWGRAVLEQLRRGGGRILEGGGEPGRLPQAPHFHTFQPTLLNCRFFQTLNLYAKAFPRLPQQGILIKSQHFVASHLQPCANWLNLLQIFFWGAKAKCRNIPLLTPLFPNFFFSKVSVGSLLLCTRGSDSSWSSQEFWGNSTFFSIYSQNVYILT